MYTVRFQNTKEAKGMTAVVTQNTGQYSFITVVQNNVPMLVLWANDIDHISNKYVGTICNSEVKVKLPLYFSLTEHHAFKPYLGSGGIAPLIVSPRH
jgi:hypothetical protein